MTEDREAFCGRFVAEMMRALPVYDGSEAELREYAEEIAPTYYDDPDMRIDGPEECALSDIFYWEAEES